MATGNYFFRRKFPYIPSRVFSQVEWHEIEKVYGKWRKAENALTVLLLFFLPWLFAIVCNLIYLQIYKLIIHAPIRFFPADWHVFFLPGIIFGLSTAMHLTSLLLKGILGINHKTYMMYKNSVDDFDNDKVAGYFTRVLFYPLVITLLMTFTSRLIATSDRFSYQNLLDIRQHTYHYTEIAKATYYLHFVNRHNEKMNLPHYKITFSDKNTFATNWYFDGANNAKEFINLLMTKGIPVDTADIDY